MISGFEYDRGRSAMRNGIVIFKLVYLTHTQDVFGMVDYDPEEPDDSSIYIVDNDHLNVTIVWGRLNIEVSSSGGAD